MGKGQGQQVRGGGVLSMGLQACPPRPQMKGFQGRGG